MLSETIVSIGLHSNRASLSSFIGDIQFVIVTLTHLLMSGCLDPDQTRCYQRAPGRTPFWHRNISMLCYTFFSLCFCISFSLCLSISVSHLCLSQSRSLRLYVSGIISKSRWCGSVGRAWCLQCQGRGFDSHGGPVWKCMHITIVCHSG